MAPKLLLFSVIIATVLVPTLCAQEKDARRGLQRMILILIAYNFFYLFAIRFIYPHLL